MSSLTFRMPRSVPEMKALCNPLSIDAIYLKVRRHQGVVKASRPSFSTPRYGTRSVIDPTRAIMPQHRSDRSGPFEGMVTSQN